MTREDASESNDRQCIPSRNGTRTGAGNLSDPQGRHNQRLRSARDPPSTNAKDAGRPGLSIRPGRFYMQIRLVPNYVKLVPNYRRAA
jgi:hypothetical protein